ncbi:MAG: reverse transcriptase domain-containing protein [Saprospiraceae bacterium]
MKRFGRLYEKIGAFDNLLLAEKLARKGKRYHSDVAGFHLRLDENLLCLSEELSHKQYVPGAYRAFHIYDPKERLISAAPYRDRVVHHALCNVMVPLIEPTFIFDSYANRKGKGTHKAISRYQMYAKQFPYVLKCDICKFFPSIDHEILKREIRRKIKCEDTNWLIERIIDNSNEQEEHIAYFPGDDIFTPYTPQAPELPIRQPDQPVLGNVYLNRMDASSKKNCACL